MKIKLEKIKDFLDKGSENREFNDIEELEEKMGLLSNYRRRALLDGFRTIGLEDSNSILTDFTDYFRDEESRTHEHLTVSDLVDYVSELETDFYKNDFKRQRKRVSVSLSQCHLPRLKDQNVVSKEEDLVKLEDKGMELLEHVSYEPRPTELFEETNITKNCAFQVLSNRRRFYCIDLMRHENLDENEGLGVGGNC